MKFYKDKHKNDFYYFDIIKDNHISCVYYDGNDFIFFKNGDYHNYKNAAYIYFDGYEEFFINGNRIGTENNFTKQSWRRFVKLQAFK